ncbi:MAG: cysteine--tRNA ligase [Myxococcota bacterium]
MSAQAAPFRLYNTRTRRMEDFEPLVPGQVGLYVCGMTVYADAHIGHARAMVVFDTFVRYLRHRRWTVRFVRNFTDVDDKIIREAAKTGEPALEFAERFIHRFHEEMAELGLTPPDAEPRVTRSIDEIITMIGTLVERGHAYSAEGSVWFSVPSNRDYGALSRQQVDELRSEDPGDGKQHAADFALWKAVKPGEPSWESPWGPGRPGWHIECSAMAAKELGETIDIHGGGLDLVFPHHENEVAQSECAHGKRYANYWMHNGLLTMESGEKMGKSKGNAIAIRELLESYPAEALRLYYLQDHYRSPLPWKGLTSLDDALAKLGRLYEAREVAQSMGGEEDADVVAQALGADALRVLELARGFETSFFSALDNDFNTSQALGHALELVRAINRLSNHKKAQRRAGPVVAPALAALERLPEALGLLTLSSEAFQAEIKTKRLPVLGITVDRVQELLEERTTARADKDWARADAIRDELENHSIVVMDRPQGSEWRVRLATAETA